MQSPDKKDSTPLGYKAEYAKSGRAHCHSCSSLIHMSELRIGPIYTHKTWKEFCIWHHPECFFKRRFPILDVSMIQGYEKLKPNAQEYLKNSIAILNGNPPISTSPKKTALTKYASSSSSTTKDQEKGKEKGENLNESEDISLLEEIGLKSQSEFEQDFSSLEDVDIEPISPKIQENSQLQKQFIESVKSGDLETMKTVLKKNVDVETKILEGITPLLFAVFKGFKDQIIELLKHSANVNTQTKLGETPLFLASKNGDLEIVKILLSFSADKNISTNHGVLPVQIAMENNHQDIVDLLKENDSTIYTSFSLSPLEMNHTSSIMIDIPQTNEESKDEPKDIQKEQQQSEESSNLSTQFQTTIIETFPQSLQKNDNNEKQSQVKEENNQRKITRSISKEKEIKELRKRNGEDNHNQNHNNFTQESQENKKPKITKKNSGSLMKEFFMEIGLEPSKFLQIFEEEEVDFEALLTLEERHLIDLGIKLGPRNKILAGISKLKSQFDGVNFSSQFLKQVETEMDLPVQPTTPKSHQKSGKDKEKGKRKSVSISPSKKRQPLNFVNVNDFENAFNPTPLDNKNNNLRLIQSNSNSNWVENTFTSPIFSFSF